MYFRDSKKETNIDNEFENNNLISTLLRIINKYKLFIIIGIIIILLIIMIILFTNRKITNYLIINGEANITLYQGSDYVEPGYMAYNSKDDDLTKDVIINSTLDTNKLGEYVITYTLGEITETRKITVIEKPKEYTYIYLKTINNNVNVYLKLGETYQEPGYQVFSSTGKDLTSEAKVTGTVDTSKVGTYKLIYSVIDSNNVTISASRTVIVMDSEISLSLNPSNPTNKEVIINVGIIDNYFDYLILPDDSKVTDKTYEYKVSENGKYTFKVYNKQGSVKESSIEVKNIDKIAPTGSCSGTYGNGTSIINITSKDTSGISKYTLNGKDYTTSKITINSELQNVNITIYDKAGNTKNISCTLKKTSDNPTPTPEEKPPTEEKPSNTSLSISSITNDGVIVTIKANKENSDISGYYFSYTNERPNKDKGGYLATNKDSIDVVRLPGTTYVWVEDNKGKISQPKKITLGNEVLLITTGNQYKILKGTKLSDYLQNNGWSVDELNKLIARSVRAAGLYTKTGAATAAVSLQTVLAQKYGIKLPYESAGIYRKFGVKSSWGAYGYNYTTKTSGYYGMDCSAFVTWTYVNTGYDVSKYHPPYWAGWPTLEFSKENGDIGDFLVKGKTQGNRHVKLIIAKTDTGFITAESSNGTEVNTHSYSSPGGYRIQKGENYNSLFGFVANETYPSGF